MGEDTTFQGHRIVVNPRSGPAWSPNPADPLREALPGAEVIELAEDDDPIAVLEAAAARAQVLGVGGGDGTVGGAAAVAIDHGLPLLVVPAGTLNHFAKDLGIAELDDTIAAARAGLHRQVDVAEIDGRVFVNNASIGAYAELVDAREQLEGAITKWPALVVGLIRTLIKFKPIEVRIDGVTRRVWLVFFGNGHYDKPGFGPTSRSSVVDGKLDVRFISGGSPWSRLRLFAAVLTGRLAASRVYEAFEATEVEVESRSGPLRLAADGETFDPSGLRVVVRKRPRALTVVVPPDHPEVVDEGDAAQTAPAPTGP